MKRGTLIGTLPGTLAVCLQLVLVPVASAQTPQAPTTNVRPRAEQEPITPIPVPVPADPVKVALGKRLFEDPRLSRDGSRSCLSCHDTRSNGASANRLDTGVDGAELPLNTLTVFNAALSFKLNWQGIFPSLEAQAESSLKSPSMGTSIDDVLARLDADLDTRGRFHNVYSHGPDGPSLLDAIGTYERSLLTPGSRFDRWLAGDATALSLAEQNGYQQFKSLGCVSCHQGVNVGGNLYQRHGIFHPLASPKPEVLRVPSLRNVATTPPYFHDGSAPTLENAIRRMGLSQLNRTLSEQQTAAIVAFLQTLTGTYQGQPVGRAPP